MGVVMRTSEKRVYSAWCVHPRCDKVWSAKTPRAITLARASARSHTQQSGHDVRGKSVREFHHQSTRRKAK